MTPDNDNPEKNPSQDISREVARRRAAQIGGLVLVILFAMLALLARLSGGSLMGLPFIFWGSLAVVLLLSKIAFNIIGWRCPSCGGSLGSGYWPRFCPCCGIRLKADGE